MWTPASTYIRYGWQFCAGVLFVVTGGVQTLPSAYIGTMHVPPNRIPDPTRNSDWGLICMVNGPRKTWGPGLVCCVTLNRNLGPRDPGSAA